MRAYLPANNGVKDPFEREDRVGVKSEEKGIPTRRCRD
jgi:hypothetical protein